MNRLSRLVVTTLFVTGGLVAGQGTARADIINIAGSTTGCFNCTAAGPFSASETLAGLTFNGSGFNVTTNAAGSASISDLGTFTLDRSVEHNYASSGDDFLLHVAFTIPTGTAAGQYLANLTGSINAHGNGDVNVLFNDTFLTFVFSNASGSGSFDLGVTNDLHFNRNAPGTQTVTGAIANAEFTPVAVPEPASLLLLGVGLTSLRLRRRLSGSKH